MTAGQRCAPWLESAVRGDLQYGSFTALRDPYAAETLAAVGYDWILVDLQHGTAHESDLGAILPAIEAAGAAPLVRVTSLSGPEIGRALDLGAWAVVVPMVDSVEQAAAAVAATRYGTQGTRSYGPIRGRAVDSDLPRCLVMIETAAGLDAVDQICAVPGLLGVFVGPSDLALGLDLAVDYEPGSGPHHDAIGTIGKAANAAGVVAAIQTAGAQEAALRRRQGFTLISMRSDWLVMRDHAGRMLAEARAIS